LRIPEAHAADPTIQELLKKIDQLTNRIDQLEKSRADTVKHPITSTPPQAASSSSLDKLTSDTPAADATVKTADAAPSANAPGASYVRNILSNTTVGGYASTDFANFDGSDSTFDAHRFVLNVSSQLHERLRFYSELEYEHGTKIEAEGSGDGNLSIADTDGDGVISADEASDVDFSVDTKNGSQGEVSVEQAWMQYDFNEQIGLRTGVILVPFGRYNLYHDDDLNNLTDRPLVARRVIPSTWSDVGVGLASNIPIGDEAAVKTEMYLVNGLNDEISDGGGALREARANLESDNNNNKAVVGRVALSPALGQEVALSGYTGSYDDDSSNISGAAVDWDFHALGFEVLGEAAFFSVEDGTIAEGEQAPSRLSGLYAEVNYPFWFDFLNETFLGKSFEDPKLIPTFRYNLAEIEERGEADNLDQDGYVIGLAYRPVQSFVLKTEWQWNDGDLERKDSDGFMASVAIGF
jgi:hypothetical protein